VGYTSDAQPSLRPRRRLPARRSAHQFVAVTALVLASSFPCWQSQSGIPLGHKYAVQANSREGMALTGLILGYITMLIAIVALLLIMTGKA